MAELVDARDLKSVHDIEFLTEIRPTSVIKPIKNNRNLVDLHNEKVAQMYTYRWDRQGRKGQTCRVTARGKFNSIRVVFDDGYVMITSGNAIRRASPSPAIATGE